MKYPQVVTIVGATGTMGKLVAGILASFGQAKVYMVCRDLEKGERAREEAVGSVRADCIRERLEVVGYSRLAECIAASDWIFESVAEDIKVKSEVNQMINQYAKDDAIISTGTSGLSVTELAQNFSQQHQKYYLGTHFFNPPYQLTLCEVIATPHTDKFFLNQFMKYLDNQLLRSVVQIKDVAGFLGNRVGFGIMNEALLLAEKYQEKGGIDYIDTLLGAFTGRSMAPIMTLDFVGLDIYKAICDHLYEQIKDYTRPVFVVPQFATELVKDGRLGKKSGGGFYKTVKDSDGKKERWVYDIKSKSYRKRQVYNFAFVDALVNDLKEGNYQQGYQKLLNNPKVEGIICINFLLKSILYALTTSQKVAMSEKDVDLVMTMGFNWIPPLGLIEVLGGSQNVKILCQQLVEKEIQDQVDLETLFNKEWHSDYDYRRYLRAKK